MLILSVSIALLAFAVYSEYTANWIGVTFKSNPHGYGILVKTVKKEELSSQINKDDIVVAFRNSQLGTVAVDIDTMQPRPSLYSRGSIKQYQAFLGNETRLASLLTQDAMDIVFIDGKTVTVNTEKRPWTQIPYNFWIQILCAIVSLVIGFIVYIRKKLESVTLHYCVAIYGFFILAVSWAIMMNRGLGINGEFFRILDAMSHFGIALIMGGILSLVWVYPRKLEPYWIPALIYPLFLIFWLIDAFFLIESLAFAFYSPLFFAFALSTTFAIQQWRATEKLPADRTVLKWIFSFLYTACSFLLFFVFVPRVLSSFTLVSPNVEYILLLFIFIGLALAITRYRMVNLEFWWSIMWGGYFTLTIIAVIYFILITTIEINSVLALSVAIFFGAITFYPFRQWVKSRIKTAPQNELDRFLPTLVDMLFTARSNVSLSNQWESILNRIFRPITLTARKNPVNEVHIAHNGVVLRVPDFMPEYAIELAYSNNGTRLFVNEDVQLAQTMYELTRKAIHLNEARSKGAEEERQRIVRDLHDDVGAKLITIIHRAGNTQVAELCRSALQDIRDIMSYLGGGVYSLLAMIADWRNEADSRCEAANIRVDWMQQEHIPNFDIDSRTRMNLTRVFRESVTNAIKHGEASTIEIAIDYLKRNFYLTITDDGKAKDISTFVKGRGLHNMADRMKEIGGKIDWAQNKPQGVIVKISINLNNEDNT